MKSLSGEFQRAASRIADARRILLATHEDPDGDGLSAMLAFGWWLSEINKDAVVYAKGELPVYLRFLPGLEMVKTEVPDGAFDLLIGFDYADFRRLGLDRWLQTQPGLFTITFDHHPGGRQKGDVQIIDPHAASTTVVVYRFFEHVGAAITPAIAACILAGIVVDTGGFAHANANAEAFAIAGEMMLKGANLTKIVQETFRKKDPRAFRLWGEALLRIKVDPVSHAALSWVSSGDLKKYNAKREAMVEFSSVLNTTAGSRCAAFLSQDADDAAHIRGSLRSEEYKDADVSKLAAAFGGGGHKLASGFKIKGEWKEVIGKLVEEARRLAGEKK